jgi:ribA/ribD-fused uncharacterized protein
MKFYYKIHFYAFFFLFSISPLATIKNIYPSPEQKEEEIEERIKKEIKKYKTSNNKKIAIAGTVILATGVACYFAWPYVKEYFSKEKNNEPLPVPDPDTPILFYNKGEPYYEFTNFWDKHPIKLDGKIWPTSEHYFQAQKYTGNVNEELLKEAIRKIPTANEVYQVINGKKHHIYKDLFQKGIRPDWKKVNVKIMHKVVKAKFEQHKDLKKLLLSTENRELIENSKTDRFWGVGKDGKGQNMLGEVLMQVRDELRA